jgi:hypothetical protein
MVDKCKLILLNFLLISVMCTPIRFALQPDITIIERDKQLELAFEQIKSSEQAQILKGLIIISKYPTYNAYEKVLQLWQTSLTPKVEKNIYRTFRVFEFFGDSANIAQIFDDFYNPNLSIERKKKLIRLLMQAHDPIKYAFIRKIKKAIS